MRQLLCWLATAAWACLPASTSTGARTKQQGWSRDKARALGTLALARPVLLAATCEIGGL